MLLFLVRHAERWWSAMKLASELEMPDEAVQSHLEQLSTRNLLDVRISESVIFSYRPWKEELARLVDEVARMHHSDRSSIVVLLSAAQGSAQQFADAFRLRKGKHDG